MISKNLEAITNYLWHQSSERINHLLLTHADFNISDYYYLLAIHNMKRPNFGDVAEALSLTKPAISALIKRLQKHEFIEKVQSEEDKRVYFLELTPKGKEIVEGNHQLYSHIEELISSSVSSSQLQALDCLLDVVTSLLHTS